MKYKLVCGKTQDTLELYADTQTRATEVALSLLGFYLEPCLEKDKNWYWEMTSDTYGDSIFGPYSSYGEALEGQERVQAQAEENNDGVRRFYGAPYQK